MLSRTTHIARTSVVGIASAGAELYLVEPRRHGSDLDESGRLSRPKSAVTRRGVIRCRPCAARCAPAVEVKSSIDSAAATKKTGNRGISLRFVTNCSYKKVGCAWGGESTTL
jgi:hypothetical protein